MADWGSESWGQDAWSADAPAPTPPAPSGDGHFPFVAGFGEHAISSFENWRIELIPAFNFAAAGFTDWIWHWMGEASLISAGKSITMKVHKMTSPGGNFGTDPIIGTTTLTANGLFHIQIPPSTIPAGAFNYYATWQSDSLTQPLVTGAIHCVEVWTVA